MNHETAEKAFNLIEALNPGRPCRPILHLSDEEADKVVKEDNLKHIQSKIDSQRAAFMIINAGHEAEHEALRALEYLEILAKNSRQKIVDAWNLNHRAEMIAAGEDPDKPGIQLGIFAGM